MSINNSPSAVGCLCVSTALTQLSVTEAGCLSHRSGWALFDSHVKPSQILVNRCRAEDPENHSNYVAGTSFTVAQIRSKLWLMCPSSRYFEARKLPTFVLYLFKVSSPSNTEIQSVLMRKGLCYRGSQQTNILKTILYFKANAHHRLCIHMILLYCFHVQ